MDSGCGPDRSRNGGEASASVILLKADGGEVLSRPSGWTYGISVPRGRPLGPDTSVRVEIRSTKDCAHLHVENRMSRHRVSRSLTADDWPRRRSVAYAGAKVTGSFRIQREKDEIRQQRLVQYLTRERDVANRQSESPVWQRNWQHRRPIWQHRWQHDLATSFSPLRMTSPIDGMNPGAAIFLYTPFPYWGVFVLVLYRHDLSRLFHPFRDDGSPIKWWSVLNHLGLLGTEQAAQGRGASGESYPTSSCSPSRQW